MSSRNYHGGDIHVLYSKLDNKRVDDVFKLQSFFMRIIGQIPMQLNSYFPKPLQCFGGILSKLYCLFCVLSHFHVAVLFLKTTYDVLQNGELEEITDALTLAIIYSFSTFSTSYLLWRSKELASFIDDINTNYRHHSMAGITFVSAKRSIVLANKITKYWLMSCFSGVGCWALAPLLMRSHTLPLNCWYPFDPLVWSFASEIILQLSIYVYTYNTFQKPIVYEILYVTHAWCQLLMGCTFGIGSAVFVSIVIIMLGQFDVLYCSLKNLDFHAEIISGKNLRKLRLIQNKLSPLSDSELNQYIFLTEHLTELKVLNKGTAKVGSSPRNKLLESLIECVHMHQFILKCCDKLEEIYSPFCLVKSLQITLQLCLLAFVGVSGQISFMRSINLVQYLVLTVSELLMFTYCGEMLKNHSVRAGDAFWRSRWWLIGHQIKQDILIFLINSKRVVRMTAGKFYDMDVQRFRSVMTQAFSFLTLLQKLAEKNNQ